MVQNIVVFHEFLQIIFKQFKIMVSHTDCLPPSLPPSERDVVYILSDNLIVLICHFFSHTEWNREILGEGVLTYYTIKADWYALDSLDNQLFSQFLPLAAVQSSIQP